MTHAMGWSELVRLPDIVFELGRHEFTRLTVLTRMKQRHCWYCLTQTSNRMPWIHEVDTASQLERHKYIGDPLTQVSNSTVTNSWGWHSFPNSSDTNSLVTLWHRFLTRLPRILEVDTAFQTQVTRIHRWYCLEQASNSTDTNSWGWHSFPNWSDTNSLVTLWHSSGF